MQPEYGDSTDRTATNFRQDVSVDRLDSGGCRTRIYLTVTEENSTRFFPVSFDPEICPYRTFLR